MRLSSNKYYFISFFTLILMILMATLPAAAHKVILYAYVEGDKIVAEASFGDGSAVKKGKVKIFNKAGQLLTEGMTNDRGICKLDIPAKTDLHLKLEAGMGHQAEYKIKKSELPALNKNNSESKTKMGKTGNTQMAGISEEKMRTIISQELDKKIAPLNKKIVQMENNQGPGMTEIIGGIGYIFGLMGLALYFTKGRK